MMNVDTKLIADLKQLDDEWEVERKAYMIEGQNGSRHEPRGEIAWLASGIGTTLAVSLLTYGLFFEKSIFLLASIPLFFIANGYGLFVHQRVRRYALALERYEERRQKRMDADL